MYFQVLGWKVSVCSFQTEACPFIILIFENKGRQCFWAVLVINLLLIFLRDTMYSMYLWFLIQSNWKSDGQGFVKGLEISLETKTRGEKSF